MIRVLHYMSGIADIKAGIETYILNLYKALDKSEYSFVILTRNSKPESSLYKEFIDNGIVIYDLNCPNLNIKTMTSYKRKVSNFFKCHRGEYDYLHMHGVDDPFVIKYAKKSGIMSCAVHAHSVRRENKSATKNLFKALFSLGNICRADHRFACSENAGRSMYNNKKFQVIKNAICVDEFSFDGLKRVEMRSELGLSETVFAFCYVGRFSMVKNLLFLLDVFEEISRINNNAMLFLLGDGEQKKEIEEYISRKNIDKKVVLYGETNRVGDLLQAMDAYLQTSFNEGFSISVLEAQCTGLPVFITNTFPEEIEITDLVHKLSLDQNAKQWARKIDEFTNLRNKKLLDKRGEYAKIVRQNGYDSEEANEIMCRKYRGL